MNAREILESLEWRYAAKKFTPKKKVSDKDLKTILEVIRLAPTSFGLQPFHVTVIKNPGKKTEIVEAAYGQKQISTATHLLVFSADMDFSHRTERFFANLKQREVSETIIKKLQRNMNLFIFLKRFTITKKSWAARQAYIALGFALMAAAELRIDSCPMEGFSASRMRRALRLERTHKPLALLALGYRDPNDAVHPKYRLPMEELVHEFSQ